MKINEKNLCAFATSATPVDREGWLGKRGDVNKAFQRRWFVLKGNLLFYFEKRQDKEPLGVIVLEGCTIELAEEEEQFSFCVSFMGAQARAYVLSADTQDSMEHWMKALACASYDYMKLMVAELQRQLDELEELGSSEGAVGGSDGAAPPRAPPRGQRYNPFNKLTESKHSRGKIERPPENVPRSKISFRELHMLYGRKILADYNEWRHKHNIAEQADTTVKTKEEDSQAPLIML